MVFLFKAGAEQALLAPSASGKLPIQEAAIFLEAFQ